MVLLCLSGYKKILQNASWQYVADYFHGICKDCHGDTTLWVSPRYSKLSFFFFFYWPFIDYCRKTKQIKLSGFHSKRYLPLSSWRRSFADRSLPRKVIVYHPKLTVKKRKTFFFKPYSFRTVAIATKGNTQTVRNWSSPCNVIVCAELCWGVLVSVGVEQKWITWVNLGMPLRQGAFCLYGRRSKGVIIVIISYFSVGLFYYFTFKTYIIF